MSFIVYKEYLTFKCNVKGKDVIYKEICAKKYGLEKHGMFS